MTSSTTAMHDDPLSFFAAEHEKDVAQIVKGGNSSAFADGAFSLFSEMWTETISPLGKEMKSAAVSAATSAADYLMQQSQSTPTDSNVENGPFRGSIAQQKEEDVSIGDANTCEEIALLTGEKILMSLKDAYIQISPGRLLPGILFMTNYRIAFVPSPAHLASIAVVNPSVYSWLNVPLASIDRVEKERKIKEARNYNITIVITCKDVRQHRISTNGGEYEIDRAFSTLSAYAFPNKMQHLFAFSHTLSPAEAVPAFERYEAIQEYSRQGIMDVQAAVGAGSPQDSLWRISTANKDYNLCRTYPQYMVMPRGMTDDELFLVSNFRSGHRLPTLSWGDKENGATMWRSSQPKAGVSGSCSHDEKFLELIAQSCVIKRDPLGNRKIVGDPILHVVDCRPRASAMANRATGAGYESQTSYPYVRLEFYNIGNIHVMRDSLKGLMSLVLSPSPPSGDMHFSRLVEDTQWLMHIRLIIKASWDTAAFIRRGQPVLVHCSHGWDRTAQVCSLAQLFLDPFYRTIDGFKVLVEKEWCSFGHPFELRCAHAQPRSSRQEDQMAPVFLQFLDCVWQLVRQYPHYFEFNCRYLVTLADHVYSCRFSTFLFSCDFDRGKNGASKCVDIWTFLDPNRSTFTSPQFMDPTIENTSTTYVLLPPLAQLMRNVTLWTDYFFRWSFYPLEPPPERYAKLLYENGVCLPHPPCGRCVDFEVSALVTSSDEWEGMLRSVRSTNSASGNEKVLEPEEDPRAVERQRALSSKDEEQKCDEQDSFII